jgi:hypothetical protein
MVFRQVLAVAGEPPGSRLRRKVYLAVWALGVGVLTDNVLDPESIGKSSHVPFILVMLGGALAFGFLGVIGPTLLAVAGAVLRDWAIGESFPHEKETVPIERGLSTVKWSRDAFARIRGAGSTVPAG